MEKFESFCNTKYLRDTVRIERTKDKKQMKHKRKNVDEWMFLQEIESRSIVHPFGDKGRKTSRLYLKSEHRKYMGMAERYPELKLSNQSLIS